MSGVTALIGVVGAIGVTAARAVSGSPAYASPPLPTSQYAYRAARRDGGFELGVLEAESHEVASATLAERGLFPLEIRTVRQERAARTPLPLADLALGLRALATLLESGLPIARALAALEELVPPSWQPALPAIAAAVREGKSLASALDACPLGVPAVVIGIVRAGEAGSGLAPAARRAAELMESSAATRSAVRGALAYPIVLAAAGTASVALLVGVVLPRFAAILADLGQALPPSTRVVLGVATALRASAVPVGILVALALVLWRAWVATEAGLGRWHAFLLALPGVGPVRRSAATAQASAALAALLESGVPVSAALVHAARATGDAAVTVKLLSAREAIMVGEGIARSLAAEDALTPTAVRLVRAGEETGRLAPMLAHVATLERERAEQGVKSAVRLLEPGLILAFGGVVALVAAALLQAMYSIRPTP